MDDIHISSRSFTVLPRKNFGVVQNTTSLQFQNISVTKNYALSLIENNHRDRRLDGKVSEKRPVVENSQQSNNEHCMALIDSKSVLDFMSPDRPISLINVGANCYLNSALQAISSCSKFVDSIVELQMVNADLNKLRTFANLVKGLSKGTLLSKEISTNRIFRGWKKTGQQDSYELLAHVLNEVYSELREVKEERGEIERRNIVSWLQVPLPIRILMQYQIKCDCRKTTFSPLQSDLAFHVSINRSNNDKSLQALLDDFFVEEVIQDYVCDDSKCEANKAYRKIRLFVPLPDSVCIHLQRTFWDLTKMQKINDRVDFGRCVKIRKEFCKSNQSIEVTDVRYSLRSVIVHHGNVSCGHYVCYKLFGKDWYYTSDFVIRKVDWEEVAACQAYVFFYEIGSDNV